MKMRRAVRGLGATKKAMGDLSEAIKCMKEVLEISEAMKDYTGDMDAVGSIEIYIPNSPLGECRQVLRHVPEHDQRRERGLRRLKVLIIYERSANLNFIINVSNTLAPRLMLFVFSLFPSLSFSLAISSKRVT